MVVAPEKGGLRLGCFFSEARPDPGEPIGYRKGMRRSSMAVLWCKARRPLAAKSSIGDGPRRVLPAIALTAIYTLWASAALSAEPASGPIRIPPSTLEAYIDSGPYCGIYSVYAFAKLHQVDVDLRDLLRPEYVGSPDGSSLGELQLAVRESGLYGRALGNLTVGFLRRTPHSIVLHVKKDPTLSEDYDHYVLFVKTDRRASPHL